MLTVYLCPLTIFALALSLAHALVAVFAMVIACCALGCVHLAHLPVSLEGPTERKERIDTLKFVANMGTGLALAIYYAGLLFSGASANLFR